MTDTPRAGCLEASPEYTAFVYRIRRIILGTYANLSEATSVYEIAMQHLEGAEGLTALLLDQSDAYLQQAVRAILVIRQQQRQAISELQALGLYRSRQP